MNIYTFTGRLGRDAEVRYTQSGTAVCQFTVAVDYGYGESKGTNWIRCQLWGKRAEGGLPQYLVKGAQVAVSGELQVREYTNRSGEQKTSVEVNVREIDLIGGKREAQAEQSPQQPSHADDPFASAPGDDGDDLPF